MGAFQMHLQQLLLENLLLGLKEQSNGTKVVKDTSAVNIDLDFKPSGLKFKGRNAITTSQLQQLSANRRNQIGSSSTTSSVASPAPPAP